MSLSIVSRTAALVVAFVTLYSASTVLAQPSIGLIKPAVKPTELASSKDAAFFQIDQTFWKAWAPDHRRSFTLSNFQIGEGKFVTLELTSFPVLTRDAQTVVRTKDGDVPFEVMKHVMMRGSIVGEPESHVYIGSFGTYCAGYIERLEAGQIRRYLISPTTDEIYSPQTMIVYDHTDAQAPKFECGMEDLDYRGGNNPTQKSGQSGKGARSQSTTPKYLTNALELTYNFYTSRGQSDVNKAYNYALLVTGGESDIYMRDMNTQVFVPYARVWNVADPYDGADKGTQLNQFRTYWNTNQRTVARNAAHLYSASNFGGVAWLDVLCESLVDGYGYAWSGLLGGYVYPSDGFYWDPFVTSHELGHNVGSEHTQSCSWNPAIDSCVAAENGNCYTNGQLRQITGTIMSYCNTRALQFHPKCATFMRNKIEASCLSNANIPVANAGSDVSLCVGETAVLGQNASGGTAPLRYVWRPSTGLSDTSIARPTVSTTVSRQYIVCVTDDNDFRTYDTVNVTSNPSLSLGPSPDKALCTGTSVKIGQAATGNGSPFMYSWSPTTGLSDPNEAAPMANPNSTTTYIQTATNQNGCIKRDTIIVTVSLPPMISLTTPPGLCPNTDVQIGSDATSGTAPYSYSWTPSTGLSATTIARPFAQPPTTTKYYVTVTDALGCTRRDSVTVSVGSAFKVNAGSDIATCVGTTLTIGDSVGGGTPPYVVRWSTKQGLSDSTIVRPQLTASKDMTYYVYATDAKGCLTRDTVMVMVSQGLTVSVENEAISCKGSSVTIGAPATKGQPPYTYLWSPSVGLSATRVSMPKAFPTKTTTYTVTVTDVFGCTATDTVRVSVSDGVKFSLGPDKSICMGTPTILSPATSFPADATFAWKNLSTGAITATTKELNFTPTSEARYELLVNDGTCSGRDTIEIKLLPAPVASITGELEFCASGSTDLVVPQGFTNYRWSNGSTTPTLNVKTAGEYWCVVTNASGCTDTARVTVIERPAPEASITINVDTLIANTATSYQWYRNNEAIAGATSQTYVMKQSGSYHVEVGNEFGCVDASASVQKNFSTITGTPPERLRIVPNPTQGLVMVKALFPETVKRVFVTTMIGTEIAIDAIREITSTNEFELDLRSLPAGSYLLHVVTESNEYVEKVIKQ